MEHRSDVPDNPGESVLILLPGTHTELVLQEHRGQQSAPNRLEGPRGTVPSLSCTDREVSSWNITEVPQSTPKCGGFPLQMQQYHCAFYKALQNKHVF